MLETGASECQRALALDSLGVRGNDRALTLLSTEIPLPWRASTKSSWSETSDETPSFATRRTGRRWRTSPSPPVTTSRARTGRRKSAPSGIASSRGRRRRSCAPSTSRRAARSTSRASSARANGKTRKATSARPPRCTRRRCSSSGRAGQGGGGGGGPRANESGIQRAFGSAARGRRDPVLVRSGAVSGP